MSTEQTHTDAGPDVPAAAEAPVDTPVPVADAKAAQQELEALRVRLAEAQDRVLRVQAEADNQRKRVARDMENAHKFALERFVADLIPVVDSLELGIDATGSGGSDLETLRQGMDLTLKKFIDTLARHGVTSINPLGEKFNPERHEAVSALPQEGAEPNSVLSVMQKGYELNGRLVRPAMVVIVKAPG